MVDKELKEWVKTHRLKGIKDSDLKKTLIEHGYTKKDAKAALKKTHYFQNYPNLFAIISILILLLATYFFGFVLSNTSSEVIDFYEENNESQVEILECNKDIDCFINAAKDCKPAKWSGEYGIELEITGLKEGKCIVHRPFLEQDCAYEQEYLNIMLENIKEDSWQEDYFEICE